MRLNGIHHITCVTADAVTNLDFYTRVLGLRLVKKTVNQHSPTVYHLFYADDARSPGAGITFFELRGASRGRAGDGMAHTIVSRVASRAALEFWATRLDAASARVSSEGDRATFEDPDGLRHELVVADADDEPLVAEHADIPTDLALQGFDGVRVYVSSPAASGDFRSSVLGFSTTPTPGVWRVAGETRTALYSYEPPPASPPRPGAGTVHHVAFSTHLAEQQAWHERVGSAGAAPSPVIDRFWFESIHFREPSGVLFELATEGPGFTADEPLESLGQRLALPPSFEARRAEIEAALRPLPATRP